MIETKALCPDRGVGRDGEGGQRRLSVREGRSRTGHRVHSRDVAAVKSATKPARCGEQGGEVISVHVIPRPHELSGMLPAEKNKPSKQRESKRKLPRRPAVNAPAMNDGVFILMSDAIGM